MILAKIFAVALFTSALIFTPPVENFDNDVDASNFNGSAFAAEKTIINASEHFERKEDAHFLFEKDHLDPNICLAKTKTRVCPIQTIDTNTSYSNPEITEWEMETESIQFSSMAQPFEMESPVYFLTSITSVDETLKKWMPFDELLRSKHRVLNFAGICYYKIAINVRFVSF